MNKVYLGIGTNVGDRYENLQSAIKYIQQFENTKIINISKIYETKPWGFEDQDDFLNICVEINTLMNPYSLLSACQQIEKNLKREKSVKWGPRTIDVDILIYDGIISKDENLILPHPRIHERAFVMIPLMELNCDIQIMGKRLCEWILDVNVQDVKEYTRDE